MNRFSVTMIMLLLCANACFGMRRSKENIETRTPYISKESRTQNPLYGLNVQKDGDKEIAEELKDPRRKKLIDISQHHNFSLKENKAQLKKQKKKLKEIENKKKKTSKKIMNAINKQNKRTTCVSTSPLIPPLNISKIQVNKEKLEKEGHQKKQGRANSMRELPTARLTPSSEKSSPSATQSLKSLPFPSPTSDLKNSTPRSLFRLKGKSKSDELLETKKRKSISPRHENFKKNNKKWWRTSRQQQLDMMLDLVLDHEYKTRLSNFCVLNADQEKYQNEGSTRKKIKTAGLP